jgi:hypothetical protein
LSESWNILALDLDNVYWISQLSIGEVSKTGKNGNSFLVNGLQTDLDYPSGITVDQNSLYWTETRGGTIKEMNLGPPLPTISITFPNGGENLAAGSTQTIQWAYTGNLGSKVKIELLKGGMVKRTIKSSTPITTGEYSWTIPANQTPGTDYSIRVTSTSNRAYSGTSDSYFSIVAPTITVVSPNGGENFAAGSTQTISWSYTGNPGSYVKIQLLMGNVVNRTIASFASKGSGGSGSYNWHIPSTQLPDSDYRIRITSTNGAYTDTSDNDFIIGQ